MRPEAAWLADILIAARLIGEWTKDREAGSLKSDQLLQSAVLRQLAIIGEASHQLSDGTRRRLPDIQWDALWGMRNVLVHVYFGVDLDVIWNTVQIDVPVLLTALTDFDLGEPRNGPRT